MNLLIFPPNQLITNTLNHLYIFDTDCDKDLVVSHKSSIVCNSNLNSEKKALGMAKSYLRLELKEGQKILYSYYIDLDENVNNEDVENSFKVMKSAIPINSQ